MSKQGYKPEITVVRKRLYNPATWSEEDNEYPCLERAYLVRGLPMPGERVKIEWGAVATAQGVDKASIVVRFDSGQEDVYMPNALTPYDPEAENVERVAKALHIQARHRDEWDVTSETMKRIYRDSARAAIAAMEDE